ncbi:hypothetical protein [Chitinophaga filiformis]|uniref:Uncharacterized protein n=1 Tax=Chitinophaga filiformis TaxID=104663 RepID=A0ABY4I5U8_CHIFI|nr:hypothetical protein [Chitinophaga filiformis]UPK71217.1 hypothetical protein MYF79_07970 [Chitinophaga filiformis]
MSGEAEMTESRRKEEGENRQGGRFGIEGISQEKQLPVVWLLPPKLQVAVLLFEGRMAYCSP